MESNLTHESNNASPSNFGQIESVCLKWFIPVLGFVYASGFLIVITFLKSYGIANIDFVEARYVHVGSFFLIACITVILPLIWIPYFRSSQESYPQVTKQTILGASLMLFVFFAVIAFAPLGFYRSHAIITTIDILSPAMLISTAWVADISHRRKTHDNSQKKKIKRLQWVWFLIQVIAAVITLLNLHNFWQMWREEPVCAAFLGLMLLIFIYGKRLKERLEHVSSPRQKFHLIISNGFIIGLFIYLAIWSFTRSIFPFIPASKGGGDFSSETPVHLIIKPDTANVIPQAIKTADMSNDLIILDESGGYVFLADKTAAGGSAYWESQVKPPVYELQSDEIILIVHDNKDVLNVH